MKYSDPKHSGNRLKNSLICIVATSMCWLANSAFLHGQAKSRCEEIEQQRAEKRALLRPERTSTITKYFDRYIEPGLIQESGYDLNKNGFYLAWGGLRSGSGVTLGIGYRRSDLWKHRFGFRASARGTPREAYMFDLGISFPRIHGGRGQLGLYTRYENSPTMDYYGAGPDSNLGDRTSYRLEDFGLDLEGRYQLGENLHLGGFIGGYFPNVGRGQRSGFPSTEDRFDPQLTPGLNNQPDFFRAGIFLQYDNRDLPPGPRAGGNYFAQYSRYWDQTLGRYDFNKLDAAIEHYIPYWNRTRVVAFRVGAQMSWAGADQAVPFYLQPSIGGTKIMRGFERYRFQDQNAIMIAVEHRWHLYSGGYGALFFEAGEVAPKLSKLNLGDLEYSGGVGIRFTVRDGVFIRIDNAVSREGYRLIWSFSNIW